MLDLLLHNESMGLQHFAGLDLAELIAQQPRGSMRFKLGADGLLHVAGGTVVSAKGVRVHEPPVVDLAAEKAARAAARERAHAGVDWSTLLRGFVPVPPRRAKSLAWLHRTPVEEWPPLRVTLNNDGSPILVDGNHRLTVARELGVLELEAEVRTIAGIMRRRVGV